MKATYKEKKGSTIGLDLGVDVGADYLYSDLVDLNERKKKRTRALY